MKISLQEIVARNLKTLRRTNNLTQQQMSDGIGLSRSTYATYELARITPDPEILYRVATRFGIKIDYLFEEKEDVFLARTVDAEYYEDNLLNLIDNYHSLSSFARGMLLEKSLELKERDKIMASNRAALEKRRGK